MFAFESHVTEKTKDLFSAIIRKNNQAALDLLKDQTLQPKHLNVKKDKSLTMLHEAAERGQVDVCEVLLDHKYFKLANECSKSGSTALHYAAASNQVAVCKLLLNHPQFTAIDVRDNFQSTPMHDAASLGHLNILQVLLGNEQSKWMFYVEDGLGKRPIDVAAPHAKEILEQWEAAHPRSPKKSKVQGKNQNKGGA